METWICIRPKRIIRALNDLTSHTTSNPAAVVQYAAIRAFDEDVEASKKKCVTSSKEESTYFMDY